MMQDFLLDFCSSKDSSSLRKESASKISAISSSPRNYQSAYVFGSAMHCTSSSPKYEGMASYSDGTPSQSVTEQFHKLVHWHCRCAYGRNWSNEFDHRASRCVGHGGELFGGNEQRNTDFLHIRIITWIVGFFPTRDIDFLCLYVAQGVGVLRSLLPTSSFRALVDGPGSQPTDTKGHNTLCVARALLPTLAVYHRMCVIAERLGCLHRLAHAARHRHFSSASTSRRSDPCV